MNIVFGLIFLAIVFGVFSLPVIARRQIYKNRELLDDTIETPDEMGVYEYKGQKVYLTPEDKKLWKTLNEREKTDIMVVQQKRIVSGDLVKCTSNGFTGLLSREDALKDGFLVRVVYQGKTVLMRKELALKRGLIKH